MTAQSVCVHGDSPGAVGMATAVREALGGIARRAVRARVRLRPVMAVRRSPDRPAPHGPPGSTPALLPCGESAFLIEVADVPEVLALHAALESLRPRLPGLADLVPAASTLLVVAEESAASTLRQAVSELVSDPARWRAAQGMSPATGSSAGRDRVAVDGCTSRSATTARTSRTSRSHRADGR